MPQKVSTLNQLYPTDCPVLLQVRSDHADWNYSREHGYIRYWRAIDHSKQERYYEHQLVAQRAYGEIPKGCHVHHGNGIRHDNPARNLSIETPKSHVHAHGRIRTFVDTTCGNCGKPLRIPITRARKSKVLYCDQTCVHEALKPVKWPTPEKLQELMISTGNWRELGRMFNVSDNAVRGWAKQYGLDLSMCDGRKKQTI